MSTTSSSISGYLKRLYGELERQQNLRHRMIDEVSKSLKKLNAGGDGFYGAMNDYGNEAGGAQNEDEAFRTIDSEHAQQWKVSPKVIVWPIEVTGLSAKIADSDAEAFAHTVVEAIDMAKERLLKDQNRQFFGLGTGALASPTGTVASDVTSFTVDSAQYLRANMVIDIYNGATKTVDSKRILDVDVKSNIVYFSTSLGAALASSSILVKENIRDSAPTDGKEMMGLRGIVDDGTDLTTFQNISCLDSRIWQAVRISASSANLTSDLLQRLLDDVQIVGGDAPDMLVSHQLQRRKYLDIVVPQRRYQDGNMDAGFKKLSFNGIDMILDEDCQKDTVYALTRKHLQKFEVCPLEIASQEDSGNFYHVPNYDKFQAYWRHYVNLGTGKRNAHGKIVSLAAPSGVI